MSFYGVHAVLADVNSVLGKSPYGHSLKNSPSRQLTTTSPLVSSTLFLLATPPRRAGFLGAGVVAALLGAIAAFLQSVGVVKVDFSALQKMFR